MSAELLTWGLIASLYIAAFAVLQLEKHWHRSAELLFTMATLFALARLVVWVWNAPDGLRGGSAFTLSIFAIGAAIWFVRKVEQDIRTASIGTIPVVHLAYEIENLLDHGHMRVHGCEDLIITNEGPGTAFRVQVADIDLRRRNQFVTFKEIPSLRPGTPTPIQPNITENGIPIFARRDLAHALVASVDSQAIDAVTQELRVITYPIKITYNDAAGRLFESNCEIRALEPPAYLRVRTSYLGVKQIEQ